MRSVLSMNNIDAQDLNKVFSELKELYNYQEIEPSRKTYITGLVKQYGYLPIPHQKALEELTDAETIAGIEEKLKINNTYSESSFNYTDISPLKRAGITDSQWCKAEQHNIKLVNLAGLGNGNKKQGPGRFIDWLKQLLILPSGNLEKGVFSTTMYLIPFHPREFGCAYLPTSSEVSSNLTDHKVEEKLGLAAKQQVQLFLTLTQLCGHPTMYDVLPQTGRFSKTILANPHVARWFDIKSIAAQLKEEVYKICNTLNTTSPSAYAQAKEIISKRLDGEYLDIPEEIQEIVLNVNELLDKSRKALSDKMMSREKQLELHLTAKNIINSKAGFPAEKDLTEEDIHNQCDIIGELINQGLWPAPGGAWCSCGVPVFNEMSEGASYPTFKHYDVDGNDVTHFANLDCQTPYYFVNLEDGTYNDEVVEFYVDFLKQLQSDYNFDGFRVDHIDHIVDKVSETKGRPISYRAPRAVLGKANAELKKSVPHFATLAEYMLWDNFLKEYHNDMSFDLLWGSDIVSQYQKTPSTIIEEMTKLEEYNSGIKSEMHKLSILKSYNNQDGEFEAIDQNPGQLGEDGALFKWFKFKFLPQGELAQRPVLHIDGDEAFNKTGIESAIGVEASMKRECNERFFKKFNAINRFALNNDFTRYGKSEIVESTKDGFVSWMISIEGQSDKLFIVANQNPTTEKLKDEDGKSYIKEGKSLEGIKATLPEGYKAVTEYTLPDDSLDFIENSTELQGSISYDRLKPSEFRVYKLTK